MAPHNRSKATRSPLVTGCFKLLVSVSLVAYFIIKIYVGSTLKHECPVQPLLPVYVILSGCFPFLLFAFTCQRYNRDQHDQRLVFRRKCCFSIAGFGAVTTLATLVLGSVVVTHVITEVEFPDSDCQSFLNDTRAANTSRPLHHVEQALQPLNSTTANSTYHHTNISPSSTTTSSVTNITTNRHVVDSNHTNNTDNVSRAYVVSDRVVMPEITTATSPGGDHVTSHVPARPLCRGCNATLLTFAVVATGLDWLLVILGSVALCCLCYRANRWRV